MSKKTVKYFKTQPKPLLNRGYTITKFIGEGSFGVVMMATSERHNREIAIKIISKLSKNNKKCWIKEWSIDNEKQFAFKFDHPYINAYYDIIETNKRLYFVMDYYKNGTLFDYCERVSYAPEPVAYEWFAQLCSALEYLHERRFAHRDIKTENVLLDHRWRIRLADFGMCVAIERPQRPCRCDDGHDGSRTSLLRNFGCGDDDAEPRPVVNSSICGSLHYMSPELLANGPYNGQLADVWAAGVLLFYLVVGRFPYNGCNSKEVEFNQRKGYDFEPDETERLSSECRLFFKRIFVTEKERKDIFELKKYDWMVKMSTTIKVPYYS